MYRISLLSLILPYLNSFSLINLWVYLNFDFLARPILWYYTKSALCILDVYFCFLATHTYHKKCSEIFRMDKKQPVLYMNHITKDLCYLHIHVSWGIHHLSIRHRVFRTLNIKIQQVSRYCAISPYVYRNYVVELWRESFDTYNK